MKAEHNELVTRVGPGTPGGQLLRQYWQPVALLDEFDPALDPRMAIRPVKAVRKLTPEEIIGLRYSADHYIKVKNNYLK